MANLLIKGDGGAGITLARTLAELMAHRNLPLFPDYQKGDHVWVFGQPITGPGPRMEFHDAVGFCLTDSNSGALQRVIESLFFVGRAFLTSKRNGYGGDWYSQYRDLAELSRATPNETRGRVSFSDGSAAMDRIKWLKGKEIAQANAILSMSSADGGSGMGIARYDADEREQWATNDHRMPIPIFQLLVFPSVSHLVEAKRADNTLATLDWLDDKVRNDPGYAAIVVDNDFAAFSASTFDVSKKEKGEFLDAWGRKLLEGDHEAVAGLVDTYLGAYARGISLEGTNPAIVSAMFPMLIPAIKDLLPADHAEMMMLPNEKPDYPDLINDLGGGVSVLAYGWSATGRSGLISRYNEDNPLAFYQTRFQQQLEARPGRNPWRNGIEPLAVWIDEVIAERMFVPFPFDYGDVEDVVEHIVVLLYQKSGIPDMATTAGITNHLSYVFNVPVSIYTFAGGDFLEGFFHAAENAELRTWVFLRLKPDRYSSILRAKAEGFRDHTTPPYFGQ